MRYEVEGIGYCTFCYDHGVLVNVYTKNADEPEELWTQSCISCLDGEHIDIKSNEEAKSQLQGYDTFLHADREIKSINRDINMFMKLERWNKDE